MRLFWVPRKWRKKMFAVPMRRQRGIICLFVFLIFVFKKERNLNLVQANAAKQKLSGYICRVHMRWPDPFVPWPFPMLSLSKLKKKKYTKWYLQFSVTLWFCVATYFVVAEDLECSQGCDKKGKRIQLNTYRRPMGMFFSILLIITIV